MIARVLRRLVLKSEPQARAQARHHSPARHAVGLGEPFRVPEAPEDRAPAAQASGGRSRPFEVALTRATGKFTARATADAHLRVPGPGLPDRALHGRRVEDGQGLGPAQARFPLTRAKPLQRRAATRPPWTCVCRRKKRCICGLPFGTLEVSGRPRRGFDLTISRLRAGLAITFAAVSLMAGAQAAEACTEPTLGDLPARGEEKQLVRVRADRPDAGLRIPREGRTAASGSPAWPTTDKVSRRFRMPNLGDSNRRVKVEVVIANDACETSPWKLEEKMTYRPAPAAGGARPAGRADSHAGARAEPEPSPPPAPLAAAGPEHHGARHRPEAGRSPGVPKSSVTPTPTAAVDAAADQGAAKEGRAWLTPADPYQKQREHLLRSSTTPRSRGSTARPMLPTAPLR